MSARTAWSGIVRSPLGITALSLMLLVTLGAIFAPIIWGAQAEQVNPAAITQAPAPSICWAPTPSDATCSPVSWSRPGSPWCSR